MLFVRLVGALFHKGDCKVISNVEGGTACRLDIGSIREVEVNECFGVHCDSGGILDKLCEACLLDKEKIFR